MYGLLLISICPQNMCKGTLFLAYVQEQMTENSGKAAKIPTLHIKIPNLYIDREGGVVGRI